MIIFPLLLFFGNCQVEQLNCEGGIDIYMIIDQSNSVKAEGRLAIANFTFEMKNRFQNRPGFRMAIYTFGSVAFPILPLTGDLSAVDKAITIMEENTINSGLTQMEKGMEFAVNEMTQPENANRNKIMFLLTDGQMTSLSLPVEESLVYYWAQRARLVRCTVISLGVGDEASLDVPLLKAAANKPMGGITFQYNVSNFAALGGLLDNFQVGTQCVNLTAVAILCGPLLAGTTTTVQAEGMTSQNFYQSGVTTFKCRYLWKLDNVSYVRDTPATLTLNSGVEELQCQSPSDEDIDNTTSVQVLYDSTGVGTFEAFAVVIPILVAGSLSPGCFVIVTTTAFPWGILLLIALLLLCLVWFLFPKMPAKKTFEEAFDEQTAPQLDEIAVAPIIPAAAPLPPPSLPPPKEKKKIRKWAKVDTTHYIWARDGGTARPMEVGWGKTGAPESAPVNTGDVEYTVQKAAAPTVVEEPEVQPLQQPVEDYGDFEDTGDDFEDREWDRCCCGLCRSDACSCCKSLLNLTFVCCGTFGKILSFIFKPCMGCYNTCNKLRPRYDCCGVGNDDTSSMRRNNGGLENNPVSD